MSTLEYLDEAAERAQQRRLADAARAGDEQVLRRLPHGWSIQRGTLEY